MNPYLWALLAAFTWGFAPIVEKIGLAKVPAMTGLFYRSVGVMIGLLILGIWQMEGVKATIGHGLGTWGYLVAGGFLASIIGQIFFYNALKFGEASQVVPIGASYPLLSFLLGVLFLGEKLTLAKAAGMLLVIAGVFLLK